jgi:hypothetical protein
MPPARQWRHRIAATETLAHRPPHRSPDERLLEGFEHMASNPWLAEHTEI